MKKIIITGPILIISSAVLFGMCLFSKTTPEVKAQVAIQVKAGHPRIFLTPSKISTLQTRAANTNSSYGSLLSWADANWGSNYNQVSIITIGSAENYDSGLLRYALIYRLGTIPGYSYGHTINEYGDEAVRLMMAWVNATTPPGYGQMTQYVAMTYDWVNDRLSGTQKAAVVNWFYTNPQNGISPQLQSFADYRFPRTTPSFYPGLAFYGDGVSGSYGGNTADQLASIYVNYIPTYLDTFRADSQESGHGGGLATGPCYAQFFVDYGYRDLYALVTATNLTIADTYDAYPYAYNFPDWWLYNLLPGNPLATAPYWPDPNFVATVTTTEDCGSYGWSIKKMNALFTQNLRMMAQVAIDKGDTAKAGWVYWLLNTRLQMPKQTDTFDFIYNDPSITPANPATSGVPLVKPFGWNTVSGTIDTYLGRKAGLGQVYMKSSWDVSSGSNTTQAFFKAFPYYYFGHQHHDSLAFGIFKKEPLALSNSGVYDYHYEGDKIDSIYGVGFPERFQYSARTQSSNSILIMEPTETIYPFAVHNFNWELKDGGQRYTGDWQGAWSDLATQNEWGGLTKFEDGTNFTYVSADATKGYNSTVGGVNYINGSAQPKTNMVQRDFVYSKSSDGNSDYFVIFDRINSLNAASKKVFLLHTVYEPVLNGNQTTLQGNSIAGVYQSANSNSATITGSSAKMFMKSLLPASSKIYKNGGGSVTTTLTSSINSTDGATINGPKIDINVADSSQFSDAPVVVIESNTGCLYSYCYEPFMCDGKTTGKLTGCIRGYRYDYWVNYAIGGSVAHSIGETVRQTYEFMFREADTGHWISTPYNYGEVPLDSLIGKGMDLYGHWQLQIENTVNENNTNFLTTFFPTTNLSAAMPETQLISSSDGLMQGALIKDSVNPRVVMFAKDNAQAQLSSVTYDATYASNLNGKHLITSLVPNSSYDIYKNGANILTRTSSNQGIVEFESLGGSTFQLLKTGTAPPPTDTTPPAAPNGVAIQ